MLENYKCYKNFYEIFRNSLKEDRFSHAYMFEIDEYIEKSNFVNDLCKFLILKDKPNIIIEKEIDLGKYLNIITIDNEDMWIKKEQILKVKEEFSKKSFDNKTKIYVIKDATKLNKSSANSLLKFLEEPDDNVIAILLTKNKYSVIPTIVSRCLNISLRYKNKGNLLDDNYALKIVDIIENYGKKSLPYFYQLMAESEFSKNNFYNILIDVQKIYNDYLLIENKLNSDYFDENDIKKINFKNKLPIIFKIIDLSSRYSENLKNNVNIKSVFDKIVIDVYGSE